MATIERIQIAFNIDDPFQRELYDFIKSKGNVSLYGKTVFARDMNGKLGNNNNVEEEHIEFNLTTDVFEDFI